MQRERERERERERFSPKETLAPVLFSTTVGNISGGGAAK